jgi:hypothetical protein
MGGILWIVKDTQNAKGETKMTKMGSKLEREIGNIVARENLKEDEIRRAKKMSMAQWRKMQSMIV